MSRPSGSLALAGGTLLASPALYAGLVDGTLPVGPMLFRFTVAVLVVWLGVTAMQALVVATSPAPEPAAAAAPKQLSAEPGQPASTPSGA